MNAGSTNERQYQMTDEFYNSIMKYLKENNISLHELCDSMHLPVYFVKKVMDRNIRMHCYMSLLVKISHYVPYFNGELGCFQKTKRSMR